MSQLLARRPEGSVIVDASDLPGPVGLLIPDRPADHELAARICARYSDRREDAAVKVTVRGYGTLGPAGETGGVRGTRRRLAPARRPLDFAGFPHILSDAHQRA